MTIKKEDRLNAIKEIIANNTIGSQENLLSLLIEKGFDLTQATLSRDLKQLKVGRIPIDEGFKYVLSNEFVKDKGSGQSAVVNGIESIAFSKNIGVVKTLPAYSHTVADFIDKSNMKEVVGTVSGNDTVMIVLREKVTHKEFKNSLIKILPELKNKIL